MSDQVTATVRVEALEERLQEVRREVAAAEVESRVGAHASPKLHGYIKPALDGIDAILHTLITDLERGVKFIRIIDRSMGNTDDE